MEEKQNLWNGFCGLFKTFLPPKKKRGWGGASVDEGAGKTTFLEKEN